MIQYFKSSIRRKFFLVMMIVFLVILSAISLLVYFQNANQAHHVQVSEQLQNKRDTINRIKKDYNQMVSRVRGYIAFSNEEELEKSRAYSKDLLDHMEEIEKRDWTDEELLEISSLKLFVNHYWEDLIPKVTQHVESGNYEAIRTISLSDTTAEINHLIADLDTISAKTQQSLTNENDKFIKQVDLMSYALIGFILIVLLILYWVTRNLSQGIGQPLSELSGASQALAAGNTYHLQTIDRKDEIGVLHRSFQEMATQINEREESLSAQNEELVAQQETLEDYLAELRNLNLALNESSIVATLNKEGHIRSANEKLSEITGLTETQLEGKSFLSLTKSLLNLPFHEAFEGVDHGHVWKGELACSRKDNTLFYGETTVVPYVNDEQEIEQYIIIQQDITSIKEAERQLRDSLAETEEARSTVEKLNAMNQSLSTTMSKKLLLERVLQQLEELYSFDHGIFFLIESEQFSSIGIEAAVFEDGVTGAFTYVIERLSQLQAPFVRQRITKPSETGYYPPAESYDLHLPVFGSTGKLIAVLVATRISETYQDYEMEAMASILDRASLSIERLDSFEVTEVNRQLNQDIIDNVNEGILFVDEEGSLVQYNQNWLNFLGLRFPEQHNWLRKEFDGWLSQVCRHIVDDGRFAAFCNEVIFTHHHPTRNLQMEVRAGEETRMINVYTETIYRKEEKVGLLFVFRDITMEFEVNQMKTNLVATVSHELRTPLASVLGYTELMIQRDLTPERQERYLKTIHSEAKRLTNLINDFLDLQRMEAGREPFKQEVFELDEVMKGLMEGFEISHPGHELIYSNDSFTSSVHADREKMIQLFTNLISNALKFSPDGGEVVVAVNNDKKNVYVYISDEGIGIPESEISKLFTKFHRIDNSSQRKIGGTGLGLAISKEIAEVHHGKITVLSEQGSGSVFTVTLPLHENISSQQCEIENVPHVVLVEDDLNLSRLLKDELRDAGLKVSHYNEGRSVLDALPTLHADAFIIDLTLADHVSGWEVIAGIKTCSHLQHLPIFISSALNQSNTEEELKVEGYLVKPYPPSKLSTVILQTLLHDKKKGQILIANGEEIHQE
ncbi:ATP-binding protein [Halobacillus rhizosphaerae]|uniref:ATP-binding protein n=1 Tax=Halobacillus rhizosphaerae TaxID=3064889 RepID=UPI00398BACC4